MASYADTIRDLTGALKNLGEQDATFARSLIRSVESRGFATEKQEHWLGVMLKRARGESATKLEAVGDLSAVYRMFEVAKSHLKKPAIVLGYDRVGRTSELTIYVAGPQSRTPGALQVKDADGTWWGRVHQSGEFEHSRRDPPPMGVTDILQRFALNPIGEAAAHGFLTGRCCFCNRKLTDPKSTAVGYGPTCAEHFGLAWGSRAPAAALVAEQAPAALPAPKAAEPAVRAPMAQLARGFYSELDPDEDPLYREPDDEDGPDPEDMAERQALAQAERRVDYSGSDEDHG